MKPSFRCLWVLIACAFDAVALGQIPYVTVRTPRSPGPAGMMLINTNAPPAAVIPRYVTVPAPRQRIDRSEVNRRVVAFQKQRAEEGFPSAQYELGMRYLTGNGVRPNKAAARKWLSEAAKGGSAPARKKLAELDISPNQDK